jgi:hypothetical protein
VVRYEGSCAPSKKLLKEPSLMSDVLSANDWSVITQYVELLKPLKDAILLL